MPNALVVYFSITGTTRQTAARVARGLRRGGFTADVAELRRAQDGTAVPSDVDPLVVGAPTHYFRRPANVSEWVRGLPRLDGVRTLAFVLHGTYVGRAGDQLRRLLRERGAAESGYHCLHGAGSYLPYARHGYQFSPGHPHECELAAAEY